MQLITEFNKINILQWRSLLEQSRYASFFQSPECYNFYGTLSCLKPFVFAIEDDSKLKGVIVGYIQKEKGALKGYLSRRAIINAGPLLSNDIDESSVIALLKAVKNNLSSKVIYIEIRNFFNYNNFKQIFAHSGFVLIPHLNFKIDTSSEEVVNSNFGKGKKRDIKVSLRNGATLVYNPSDSQVSDYYNILEHLYKTKVKTPLFPLSFFTTLNMLDEGHIILVEYNETVIGGVVCVGCKGQPLYEWFACGEIHKNIHASTLATYGGILFAAQNGYPIFDMMGAGKPDKDYGVRDFKAGFGGKLVEDGRYLAVLNPILYNIGKIGVKILKSIR